MERSTRRTHPDERDIEGRQRPIEIHRAQVPDEQDRGPERELDAVHDRSVRVRECLRENSCDRQKRGQDIRRRALAIGRRRRGRGLRTGAWLPWICRQGHRRKGDRCGRTSEYRLYGNRFQTAARDELGPAADGAPQAQQRHRRLVDHPRSRPRAKKRDRDQYGEVPDVEDRRAQARAFDRRSSSGGVPHARAQHPREEQRQHDRGQQQADPQRIPPPIQRQHRDGLFGARRRPGLDADSQAIAGGRTAQHVSRLPRARRHFGVVSLAEQPHDQPAAYRVYLWRGPIPRRIVQKHLELEIGRRRDVQIVELHLEGLVQSVQLARTGPFLRRDDRRNGG
jgi:hypothetical protein